MAGSNSRITILILNVNGLNAPIKRHRLANWIKRQEPVWRFLKALEIEIPSKDLESTQMPIDDRLDWENVAHIHHGILCSNQK